MIYQIYNKKDQTIMNHSQPISTLCFYRSSKFLGSLLLRLFIAWHFYHWIFILQSLNFHLFKLNIYRHQQRNSFIFHPKNRFDLNRKTSPKGSFFRYSV